MKSSTLIKTGEREKGNKERRCGFRLKISIMEIRDAKVGRLNPGIVPGIVIESLSVRFTGVQ